MEKSSECATQVVPFLSATYVLLMKLQYFFLTYAFTSSLFQRQEYMVCGVLLYISNWEEGI